MIERVLKCGVRVNGMECGGTFVKVIIEGKLEYACRKCGWVMTAESSRYEPEEDEYPD